MTEHRYILEPYKTPASRYDCPGCGKRRTFSRYLDIETGKHLHDSVGRCNREINCGYHYIPKQYFQDNKLLIDTKEQKQYKPKQARTPQPKPPVSLIPFNAFEKSLQQHTGNSFVKFLCALFGVEITNRLIEKYFIGTSKQWNGANVFWQIDISGRLRSGKIMLYNYDTGKRMKEKINWVHSVLKIENFNLKQCFFGEHLLKGNTKPVAIVESEKTAVIASVYLPGFIWLSVGSLTNLSAEKCKVLLGRSATLFPDLNGFEKWYEKKKELQWLFPGTRFNISDLLERKATETERHQGLDLADYLIRFDYRAFQQEQPEPEQKEIERPQSKEVVQVEELSSSVKKDEFSYTIKKGEEQETRKSENWEREIKELETYFAGIILPHQPVKPNRFSTITNVPLFLETHFATLKANSGKRTFLPYLNRLQELKHHLSLNNL